jgi:head-tail adaptor
MNAGDRDREILLQTATTTQDDDTGEEVIDWDDAAELTLYAQWLPENSREAYFAQQRLAAHISGIFRVEYIDRPSPATNRIVWEDRVYDIKGVTEVGRREGWEIAVEARGE